MQTHGGAEANAVITSPEREFVVDLRVDWSGNGLYNNKLSHLGPFADEIVVDRSLSGSMPQELMLVEGAAAAELTFTLGGEIPPNIYGLGALNKHLNWVSVFSPYNGESPLYNTKKIGAEITYRIGVQTAIGVFWYPQFIGNVRLIEPRRADNSVTITALDRSELMRQPVDIPLWAMSSWHAGRGYEEAQLVSSHWLIDQCLRGVDISTTPYRPITTRETDTTWPFDGEYGLQFYMTGNGSYLPSVGTMSNARVFGFPWSEGTGPDMYAPFGRAHPLVETETLANGTGPLNLAALKADASGVVPRVISTHPSTTDTDAGKSPTLLYRMRDVPEFQANKNATHFFGFTLITTGDSNWWQTADTYPMEIYIGGNRTLRIHILANSARAELWNWVTNTAVWGGPWVGIPTGQPSVEIGCQVYNPFGIMKMGARADNNVTAWADVADVTTSSGTDDREGNVKIIHRVGMQDIYYSNRFINWGSLGESSFSSFCRKPATYAAILDVGLNKLSSTTATSYDDGWALAASVASAELGAIFWDESGIFRFWNRDTITAKQQDPVRTLTLDDVGDLGMTDSIDSLRNIISTQNIMATADQAVVFDLSDVDQFYLAPGAAISTTLEVSDSSIQAVTPGKVGRYATTPDANVPLAWSDSVFHGYVVEFNTGNNGTTWVEKNHFISGVDVYAYTDNSGKLTITFYNGYSEAARFSKMHLGGTLIVKQSDKVVRFVDESSVDEYGPKNLPMSGDWVQYQPQYITRLGTYILNRTTKTVPVTDTVVIAGDPRLQLGDALAAVDPDGFGEDMRLQILGIRREFSKAVGLVDNLTVELTQPPRVGRWDSAQYGRWDTTFIWSA
jgi:hypothetical protein